MFSWAKAKLGLTRTSSHKRRKSKASSKASEPSPPDSKPAAVGPSSASNSKASETVPITDVQSAPNAGNDQLNGVEDNQPTDPQTQAVVNGDSRPSQEIEGAMTNREHPPTQTVLEPSSSPSLNIIVIGAGIGGLATAFLLGKAGHKVTIVEAASQLGEVGAGIQLSPNVTRLLIRWGVGDKLAEIAVVPQNLTLRRYENGEVVGWMETGQSLEKAHKAPYYHVHRADIHGILAEIAEPHASIRLNSRVKGINPSIPSVTLESGETIAADLVIGADGLHSITRDIVVGKKDNPTATGDAAYRAVVPAAALLADPDLEDLVKEAGVNVWMGPGRHIVGYCIRNKELYNLVLIHPAHEDDENVREVGLERMKADFDQFEPRVRKLLELVTSAMVWSLKDRQPLESWVHPEGKVCLLGDACHPMLPYRAQGAAMAIEDAAVLANLLSRSPSKKTLPAVLKAYQDLRHSRATATQTASRLNQHIFHLPDGPAQAKRDASMREAMEAALREARGEDISDCVGSANLWADRQRNKEAFDYDADEEVEKWWQDNGDALTRG
ncbi:salicylate hydroxylase [Coprinopsis cinerea AmutBmut pab1-1]|nr:salicylate hydroxylase [Coprinopsis cinerea AmutBmut pab1-1]